MLFFVVAFNLSTAPCVAGPSKARYPHIICDNPAAIIGLSHFTIAFNTFCSPALGVSALRKEAAAAASAKRKDTSSESKPEKKRKSALEEIIEVEIIEQGDAFEPA